MSLSSKTDAYLDARAERDRLALLKTKAEKFFRAKEQELIEEMLNNHEPSIAKDEDSRYGKLNIGLRRKLTLSVTKANQDDIRAWLTENTGDDAEFVIEKVNGPALMDWLEEQINNEEVQPEDLPEFMRPQTRPGISVLGWKNRKM
jgi:hypothetical protein